MIKKKEMVQFIMEIEVIIKDKGQFKDVLRNGKFYIIGNLIYNEDWVNDKMEGHRIKYYQNGIYYNGKFKNNLPSIKWKIYNAKGNLMYDGE